MTQPQAGSHPTYNVRWRRGSTTWTIRWLQSDRSYFGEYNVHEPVYLGPIYFCAGHAGGFEGSLAPADYAEVVSLIDTIKLAAPATDQENTAWLGILGQAPYGTGRILFRSFENSPRSVAEDAFAGIVAVFEKYMKPIPSNRRVVARALRHNPVFWLKSILRGGRCTKCGCHRGRLRRKIPCWGCGDVPS